MNMDPKHCTGGWGGGGGTYRGGCGASWVRLRHLLLTGLKLGLELVGRLHRLKPEQQTNFDLLLVKRQYTWIRILNFCPIWIRILFCYNFETLLNMILEKTIFSLKTLFLTKKIIAKEKCFCLLKL